MKTQTHSNQSLATSHANARKQGSIILASLIFGTVLCLILVSLIKYSTQLNRTAHIDAGKEMALQIAESGIEIGINDLQSGAVNSSPWTRQNLTYQIGKKSVTLNIAIVKDSTNSSLYEIYSAATIEVGTKTVRRYIQVSVESGANTAEESSSSGVYPYAIMSKGSITINHGNNDSRPKIASYNSDETTDPTFDFDTGFDAIIGSVSSVDNAINVNNAVVRGVINSGGGTINYDSGKTNSNQLDQNMWLSSSEEDNAYGINYDSLLNSFNAEVPDPEFPTSEGKVAPSEQTEVNDEDFWSNNSINYGLSQNFWQNGDSADHNLASTSGNTRTVGLDDTDTILTTPSINLQNNSTLVIKGNVTLIVKRNFNISGTISFEPGATLEIVAAGNNHFTGSSDNAKPSQFTLTPYVDLDSDNPSGPNVQFNNTDRIAMVINAPYSSVSTGGQGNGTSDFMGAVVAESFSSPNGMNFFYDVSLNESDGGDDGDEDSDDTFESTGIQVLAWSELYPKTATSLFEDLGINL